jgi:hypothetical protein
MPCLRDPAAVLRGSSHHSNNSISHGNSRRSSNTSNNNLLGLILLQEMLTGSLLCRGGSPGNGHSPSTSRRQTTPVLKGRPSTHQLWWVRLRLQLPLRISYASALRHQKSQDLATVCFISNLLFSLQLLCGVLCCSPPVVADNFVRSRLFLRRNSVLTFFVLCIKNPLTTQEYSLADM